MKEAGSRRTQLINLSDTRFLQRHDGLLLFVDHYSSVIECLEDILRFMDRKTADKARVFLHSLTDPVLIVALYCAKKVMCLTLNLSRALQTVNKNLIETMEGVGFVIRTLKSWRTVDNEWTSDEFGSFSLAQQLAERIGVNITTPRLASRQNHRNNVPAINACEYFRRAVWFPYLDAIIVIQQQI